MFMFQMLCLNAKRVRFDVGICDVVSNERYI